METSDIKQKPAGNHWRVFVRPVYAPMPAAEMICRGAIVENLAEVAEVIERVDVVPQCVYIEIASPE